MVGDENDHSSRQRIELSRWQVAEPVNDIPGVRRRRDMAYFLLIMHSIVYTRMSTYHLCF